MNILKVLNAKSKPEMYLTSAMLLVVYLTTSHQQGLDNFMTSVEPSETGTSDSDTTLGVSPTELLTPDYSTFDNPVTPSSMFAYTDTDNTATNDYSHGDTTAITSSSDTFTETTSTDLFTTADSDSDSTAFLVETTSALIDTTTAPMDTTSAPIDTTTAPMDTTTAPSDTTIAPIDTHFTPAKTQSPAKPIFTTIVPHVNTTSTTELFNTTNITTAGVRSEDDSNAHVIVGAVVGGVAGAGAAMAIAILALRYRRRRDLNSNDEFTPGLKDGPAPSSQRRPNTYILSMSSNVRSETAASAVYANAAEANELNTLRVTDANVEACPDNDAIYNNTKPASSNENDDVYNNTPGPSEKRSYDSSKYAGGPARLDNDEMYNNTGRVLGTKENDVLNYAGGSLNSENCDIYSGVAFEVDDDGVYERTDGPLGEGSGVLITLDSRGLKAENDAAHVTTGTHSNVGKGGYSEAQNEGLYEKPDGPRSVESEDLYESYDGAPITEEDFNFSSDEVKPHQDSHNARDTARLSTDSLYINAPKELPPISLRDRATSLITGKSPGPASPHSGYYKTPREVCVMMGEVQTEADDADLEDHEYVNIKSVKTLRDDKTTVAEDDVLASADGNYESANDAGLGAIYNNTAPTKR